MTDATWAKVLGLLEENQQRILGMKPSAPVARVTLWRESPHRTLGHLVACQAAWLPYMRAIEEGAARASIPIRPDPLFTKLGLGALRWELLVERFVSERREWRQILEQSNLDWEVQTPTRVLTARSLTKRMVDHERSHLDQLG